jgi:hypothetical protein
MYHLISSAFSIAVRYVQQLISALEIKLLKSALCMLSAMDPHMRSNLLLRSRCAIIRTASFQNPRDR